MKDSSEKSVILLVEDDADCREMLSDLLSNEGYTVVSAENGLQALDYLRRSTAELIILDLMMPVMSGWNSARCKRATPDWSRYPLWSRLPAGLSMTSMPML